MDPRDPDRLYAATWDRHRTVAALMGGGPGSGVWMSGDGGETWKKLETGLPSGPLGKIGLAISPQRPDIVYATIEMIRREGGVWMSEDQGESGGRCPMRYREARAPITTRSCTPLLISSAGCTW
jgi:hypothetical protein